MGDTDPVMLDWPTEHERAMALQMLSVMLDEAIDLWTEAYTEHFGVPPKDPEGEQEEREPWQGEP